MGKKNLNPSDIANKWAQSMGSAGPSYTQGVQSVQVSPGQSALAAKDKYLAGVQRSYSDGTLDKGLQSFTLQDWQNSAVQKGASRLGSGAQASKGKMQTFLSGFLPALQSIQQQVNSMPTNSYEDRKAKANALMDAVHALKGQFRTK